MNAKVRRERILFLKRVDEILADRAAVTQFAVRRRYVEEALDHLHAQLAIDTAAEVDALNGGEWSLTTAMYYAGTIFTTIGYGDVVCNTVAGQIATVVYAIVGIPVMLITLSHLGKFLYKWINEIVAIISALLDQILDRIFPSRRRKSANGEKSYTKLIGSVSGDGGTLNYASAPVIGNNNGNAQWKKQSSASVPVGAGSAESEHRVSFVLHTGEDDEEEELTLDMDVHNDSNAVGSKMSSASPPPKILIASPREKAKKLAAELKAASTDVESGITNGNLTFDDNEELLPDETPIPRMPVSVALSCTLSWIFFCAALFKLWETDWTYAESCYFMFISLSTIGLGDVNVKRKDLMVVCFIFVIIGLSLVSMCINVIQSALEDLYRKLLMKILLDYQAKIAEGGDAHSASMGMMKMWGSSKTAKYLMPMLSADTRRAVMQKVQEDAKETGIEIPPIFEDMDDKTGMPKILAVAATTFCESERSDIQDPSADLERHSAIVSELVRQSDVAAAARPLHKSASQLSAQLMPSSTSPPGVRPICYDNDTQTDRVFSDEKTAQTTLAELDDLAIQTEDLTPPVKLFDVQAIQTDFCDTADRAEQTDFTHPAADDATQTRFSPNQVIDASKTTQTDESMNQQRQADDAQTMTDSGFGSAETSDAETMTIVAPLAEMDVQTDKVFSDDAQIQTHLFDLAELTTQTDAVEMKNERVQTPYPELVESEMQTDEIEDPSKSKNISKIRQARRRLQRALAPSTRRVSYGDRPSMGNWRDPLLGASVAEGDSSDERLGEVDEEDDMGSSYESLNWDPIDGMHAEKQRPVSDLKKLFDRGSRRSGPTSGGPSTSSQALNRTFSATAVSKKKFSHQESKK